MLVEPRAEQYVFPHGKWASSDGFFGSTTLYDKADELLAKTLYTLVLVRPFQEVLANCFVGFGVHSLGDLMFDEGNSTYRVCFVRIGAANQIAKATLVRYAGIIKPESLLNRLLMWERAQVASSSTLGIGKNPTTGNAIYIRYSSGQVFERDHENLGKEEYVQEDSPLAVLKSGAILERVAPNYMKSKRTLGCTI